MGHGPDENLIQSSKRLTVIQICLNHRSSLRWHSGGIGRPVEELYSSVGGERDEDPWIAFRIWVDTDHRLTVEVLGDVGHQPVLPDHDDQVLGREEEPRQIRTEHSAAAPLQWQ